jgi:hypothetical protein
MERNRNPRRHPRKPMKIVAALIVVGATIDEFNGDAES